MIKRRKSSRNSKFARMSEEERARYMQYRAEFELEAKRRKQQLIATYIKNKLKRENVFSKLNTAKINEKWRLVLRQIKCKEIYNNVEYLSEAFDRIISLKDETICRLQRELEITDQDHRKLRVAHIELMNDIIVKYKQKLQKLHDLYKSNNNNKSNVIELCPLNDKIKGSCKEMQLTVRKENKILEEERFIAKTRNAINIRNILILEEDATTDLVRQSSENVESLWEQLNTTLSEYERVTKNKKEQYEYLKEQDNAYQLCILRYPRMHLQLQRTVESFKCNIQTLSLNRDERIENLKRKSACMKKEMRNMKQYFTVTRAVDFVQLKKLIVSSNDSLKTLQKSLEKGSMLLEIIAICSNLEPYIYNLKNYFMEDEIPSLRSKIDMFWEKHNRVASSNILLKNKCKKLNSENKRLRCKLQARVVTFSGGPTISTIASTSI